MYGVLKWKCCSRKRVIRSSWYFIKIIFLVIINVATGTALTEFMAFGMRTLEYYNYFTIAWWGTACMIMLLPFLLIYDYGKKICTSNIFCSGCKSSKKAGKNGNNLVGSENVVLIETINTLSGEIEELKSVDDIDDMIEEKNERNLGEEEEEKEDKSSVEHLDWNEHGQEINHPKMFVRSFVMSAMNIFLWYFSSISLEKIPPSIYAVIYNGAGSIPMMIFSIITLWSIMRRNIVIKVSSCLLICVGVAIISFGSEGKSSQMDLSNYPDFTEGVIFVLIAIISLGIYMVYFVKVFIQLSFYGLMYLNMYIGLTGLLVFWVVLPLLAVTGVEPITWEMYSNWRIWLFLMVCGVLTTFFSVISTLLLKSVGNPVLLTIIMVLASMFTMAYDYVILGVRYSFVVFLGVFIVLSSAAVMNLVEYLRFDITCVIFIVLTRRKTLKEVWLEICSSPEVG